MKLPELSAAAAPQFVDAASCKAWLEQLPLANVASAQHDLLAEVEVFNTFPASSASRLAVMEALREAVNFVQVEQAKRFMNRALPMVDAEAAVFEDTVELWEQMRLGYLRCLEAALGGDTAMRTQAALLAQRIGAYSGLRMFHYYRAYREVPRGAWRALHEVYAHAERLGVAEEPVKDFLNRDIPDSSPRIAYARAVLMGLANPQELAQRQLTFVAFLLERWASKLEVSATPVPEEKGVLPLLVDLAGDRLPERAATAAQGVAEPRYLDTRKLAKSLRNRVGLLRKGESPARLALGEDCVQPSCEQLLVFLFRQWCQAKPAVSERRRGAPLQVCNDFGAVHHYVSGGALRLPMDHSALTMQQRQELETLGRVRTAPDEEYSNAHGYMLEDWTIEDEGPQELRVRRAAGAAGKRFSHGQLVAVRPEDAGHFLLGQIRWLTCSAAGELRAGVKLLPGIPAALLVRPVGLNEKSAQTIPALALGAVPALEAPPSLVLPAGSFRPGRVLERLGDKPQRLRLAAVIERGLDFERVAHEAA